MISMYFFHGFWYVYLCLDTYMFVAVSWFFMPFSWFFIVTFYFYMTFPTEISYCGSDVVVLQKTVTAVHFQIIKHRKGWFYNADYNNWCFNLFYFHNPCSWLFLIYPTLYQPSQYAVMDATLSLDLIVR